MSCWLAAPATKINANRQVHLCTDDIGTARRLKPGASKGRVPRIHWKAEGARAHSYAIVLLCGR